MPSVGANGEGQSIEQLQREVGDLRLARRRSVAASDADRRALERRLHGGLQQDLVALAAGLQLAVGLIERDHAAARELVNDLATMVRGAIEEANGLAEAIYPPLLEARGLAGSLRSAAANAGVAVDIDVRAPVTGLWPAGLLTAIYWSCVDLLAAAPRESRGSISVIGADRQLTFSVELGGGYGDELFERVRDRLEALGGRVTIDSLAGRSRVSAAIPLSG